MDDHKIKTLYVCGCSFLTVLRKDRTHSNDLNVRNFVDLYAQQKNFAMVNLARPGASNFNIELQIDHAIRDRADYVIIGATSPDRFDISNRDQLRIDLPLIKLSQVIHSTYNSESVLQVEPDNPFLITNTLPSLLDNTDLKLNPDQYAALKSYVAFLHNNQLQLQKDGLIIEAGLSRLLRAGIEFIFLPGPLKWLDWTWLENKLWPDAQPWDLPLGFQEDNINHNPPAAHEMFLSTLNKITPYWQ